MNVMIFDRYRLPDGTEIKVDATAAKGSPQIDFALSDGRMVKAVRVVRLYTQTEWHKSQTQPFYRFTHATPERIAQVKAQEGK